MKEKGQSFHQFFFNAEKDQNVPSGLFNVLYHLTAAGRFINREVSRAGLTGVLGDAGSVNVQGEDVQKLDLFANDLLIEWLSACKECAAIGSEENEDVVPANIKKGQYVVAIDPLDGSSNIDVTAPIGTIFSIYERVNMDNDASEKDFLRKGSEQVAAGYIIYGSSTILVLTTGKGVNGFTLDPASGEFILSHPRMKMPQKGKIYSLNEGYDEYFDQGTKAFLKYCKEIDKVTGRPYSGRYIGSLVADFHRTLVKGGIFLYPTTKKSPKGKLRLVYEAHPMAFLAEQAGGVASNGETSILQIKSTELHQRVGLITGSKELTEKALSVIRNAT